MSGGRCWKQSCFSYWSGIGKGRSRIYLGKYPDLQTTFGQNYRAVINHWLQYGILERRQGSANFEHIYYLSKNPDITFDSTNSIYYCAIKHWLTIGIKEGRPGISKQE